MKNQIEKTLSRSAWDKVVIQENNDPLVEVTETPKLKIGLISKSYTPSFSVRKIVAEKLVKVSENLPSGICLVLIEGYRSLESQQQTWDIKFERLKTENPELTDEEIEKQVRLVVAKPTPLANHHCGGVVDVALIYEDGRLLDMGTPYPGLVLGSDFNTSLLSKTPMLLDQITENQKANRKILRDAMETEDFVWYPGEWWHYC